MCIDLHQDVGTAMGDENFQTHGQTSLDQLRNVGISICLTTDYWRVPEGKRQPKGVYTIEYYVAEMRDEEKFILTQKDVPDFGDKNLGLLLVQEGFAVPEPDYEIAADLKINSLFTNGIRVLQPIYQGNKKHKERTGKVSPIGTSSFDDLEVGERDGLTELGKFICRCWLQKGGILDGSHSSPQTLRDLVKICKELRKPLLVSHTGIDARGEYPRCLSDEQLDFLSKELEDTGFLIGIGAGNLFFKKEGASDLFPWRDTVYYVANKVGWEHIGIGSDLGGALSGLPGDYESCEEIFPDMLHLLKQVIDEKTYRKVVFENAAKFLRKNLPKI